MKIMTETNEEVRIARWIGNDHKTRKLRLTIQEAASLIEEFEKHINNTKLYTTTIEQELKEQNELKDNLKQAILTWPETIYLLTTVHGIKEYIKACKSDKWKQIAQNRLFLC